MKCHRSAAFALLLWACAGPSAEPQRPLGERVMPAPSRIGALPGARMCLNATEKGREFLVKLMDAELDLLPEYGGANVFWLFHRG